MASSLKTKKASLFFTFIVFLLFIISSLFVPKADALNYVSQPGVFNYQKLNGNLIICPQKTACSAQSPLYYYAGGNNKWGCKGSVQDCNYKSLTGFSSIVTDTTNCGTGTLKYNVPFPNPNIAPKPGARSVTIGDTNILGPAGKINNSDLNCVNKSPSGTSTQPTQTISNEAGTYNYELTGNNKLIICGTEPLSTCNNPEFYYQPSTGTYNGVLNANNTFVCRGNFCNTGGTAVNAPAQGSQAIYSFIQLDPNNCGYGTLTTNGPASVQASNENIEIFNTAVLKSPNLSKSLYPNITCLNSSFALTKANSKPGASLHQVPPQGGSGGGGPVCEGSGALDFVYCAIYNALSGITNLLLKDFIQPQLKVEPICITPSSAKSCSNNQYIYSIWANFRTYGDIILIIALLVAIISEAIGGGLISAYSVRKILPRILIAAILVNISIYIVAALVDIFNIIGGSIGALITAPIKNSGFFVIHPDGTVVLLGAGAAGLFTVFHLAHMHALTQSQGGSLLVDMFVIPTVLIILSVFATVLIRKTLLFTLIIVSPVAFGLYCLPSTEKIFKKWWSLLKEMLFVYPIIMIMFAVSAVMSAVASNESVGTGSVNAAIDSILALIFTVLPLALIPLSFKLAGDTLSKVHGSLEGQRAKLSKSREQKRKQKSEQFAQRVQTNKSNRYASLDRNGRGDRIASIPGARRIYNRRRATVQQADAVNAANTAKTPGGMSIEHDNEAQRAATYLNEAEAVKGLTTRYMSEGATRNEAENRARSAAAAARTSIGYTSAGAQFAAAQLAATGTGYKDLDDMTATIARVSRGNSDTRKALSGNLNAINKQASRPDLAPGYEAVQKLSDLQEEKLSKGIVPPTLQAELDTAKEKAWNGANLYTHGNAKPANMLSATEHYGSLLRSTNQDDQDKGLTFYKEMQTLSQNATGENRDIAAKFVEEHRRTYEGHINNFATERDASGTLVYASGPNKGAIAFGEIDPVSGLSRWERINMRARAYNKDPNTP